MKHINQLLANNPHYRLDSTSEHGEYIWFIHDGANFITAEDAEGNQLHAYNRNKETGLAQLDDMIKNVL